MDLYQGFELKVILKLPPKYEPLADVINLSLNSGSDKKT